MGVRFTPGALLKGSMSKFDFMNGLELKRAPQRLMTLGELISVTQPAEGYESIRAIYQGSSRCIVPNHRIEMDVDGNRILALKASGNGFVLMIQELRKKKDLDIIGRAIIAVQWHGAGTLYVAGIDLNDHVHPGIYLSLVEKL